MTTQNNDITTQELITTSQEASTMTTQETTTMPTTTTESIPSAIQSIPAQTTQEPANTPVNEPVSATVNEPATPTVNATPVKTCVICGTVITSTRRRKLCGSAECKAKYMGSHHKKWLESGENRKKYNEYMRLYTQKQRDAKKLQAQATPELTPTTAPESATQDLTTAQ